MAVASKKNPFNESGPIYVDHSCIDCDVCRDTAPQHFRRNDEFAYSYVHRQPATDDEYELCIRALKDCPVDAIGDDGAAIGRH